MQDRPADALAAANRAVALAPQEDWPHRLASLLLSDLGRHKVAVRAAQEGVRLAPHQWQSHSRLASALSHLPSGGREAWDVAMEAVRLGPHESAVHCTVGHVALVGGHLPQAEQAFRQALALDPNNAAAQNDLALVALRRGRLAEAASGFSAGVRTDPTLRTAVRNLDVTLWRGLSRVHWFVVGIVLLSGVASSGQAPGTTPAPQWAPALYVAVVLAIAGVLARRFWRGLTPSLRPYLLSLPRRRRSVGAVVLAQALGLLLLASLTVTPRSAWADVRGIAVLLVLLAFVPLAWGSRKT